MGNYAFITSFQPGTVPPYYEHCLDDRNYLDYDEYESPSEFQNSNYGKFLYRRHNCLWLLHEFLYLSNESLHDRAVYGWNETAKLNKGQTNTGLPSYYHALLQISDKSKEKNVPIDIPAYCFQPISSVSYTLGDTKYRATFDDNEKALQKQLLKSIVIDVLDNKIRNIGEGCCANLSDLQRFEIRYTTNRETAPIYKIEKQAFYHCGNKEQVFIPTLRYVQIIGESAFEGSYLYQYSSGFILSGDAPEIQRCAFKDTNLNLSTYLEVSKYAKKKTVLVGEYAFENTLTSNIPQCVEPGISKGCYKNCKNFKKSPTWIIGTTGIGDEGFEGTGLTKLVTPSTLIHMGRRAFANCNNLTTITLNQGLVSIGPEAFKLDNAEEKKSTGYSIIIPKTVKYIHSEAFKNRTNLTTITFEEGRSEPLYIGWDAFYNTGITTLELPHDTVVLGQGFVHSCKDLQSISFRARESTESIEDNKYTTYIGNWCFYGCNKLTTIDFTNKGNNWKWAINFGANDKPALGVNMDTDGYGYKFEAYSNNEHGYGGGQHLYDGLPLSEDIELTLIIPWEMVQYSNIPPNTKYLHILGSEGRTFIELYEQLSTAYKLVDIYLSEKSLYI